MTAEQTAIAAALTPTQQDIAEFHQQLSHRYDLKDGDTINNITGRITKKKEA